MVNQPENDYDEGSHTDATSENNMAEEYLPNKEEMTTDFPEMSEESETKVSKSTDAGSVSDDFLEAFWSEYEVDDADAGEWQEECPAETTNTIITNQSNDAIIALLPGNDNPIVDPVDTYYFDSETGEEKRIEDEPVNDGDFEMPDW